MSVSRRVFIKDDSNINYKIFSFTQNSKGDIYCKWPSFEKTDWLHLFFDNQGNANFLKEAAPTGDRLTFHASGMSGRKSIDTGYKNSLYYNSAPLIKGEGNLSCRHLFTIQIQKPHSLPDSPYLSRKNDCIINVRGTVKPCVMVVFAIPKMNLEIEFGISSHIKNLPSNNLDDFLLGYSLIELEAHLIVSYVYRTAHMNNWPEYNRVSYSDGFHIPAIIGTEENAIQLALLPANYSFHEKKLQIHFSLQTDTEETGIN